MKYRSVAEAQTLPGLRLVLTAHMPGPWGVAAQAVLTARQVRFIPVEQLAMQKNDDLFAWTGLRNAPIAVLDDEPPLSTWHEILLLAERLGSGPSLIPADSFERALMLGICTEIAGPEGFGWSRRLEMIGLSSAHRSPAAGDFDMARLVRTYGVNSEAVAQAPKRVISFVQAIATQLHRQNVGGGEYLVGSRLSAADLYWAAFSQFIAPLPAELCAMPGVMREAYSHLTPELAGVIDPILLQHRDMVFDRHIGLPLDF